MADDHLLTFAEAAQLLGISVMGLHYWTQRRAKRPALECEHAWEPRRGKYIRVVRVGKLDAFMSAHKPKLRYKLTAARYG